MNQREECFFIIKKNIYFSRFNPKLSVFVVRGYEVYYLSSPVHTGAIYQIW